MIEKKSFCFGFLVSFRQTFMKQSKFLVSWSFKSLYRQADVCWGIYLLLKFELFKVYFKLEKKSG